MTFGGNDQGLAHAYGGFNMAQAMIGQQNSHLQNMANQINSTISDQNENMVAQQREQRRLEHEKQMKQMEIDALLARLQQVQPPQGRQPVASGRNFSIYHD